VRRLGEIVLRRTPVPLHLHLKGREHAGLGAKAVQHPALARQVGRAERDGAPRSTPRMEAAAAPITLPEVVERHLGDLRGHPPVAAEQGACVMHREGGRVVVGVAAFVGMGDDQIDT